MDCPEVPWSWPVIRRSGCRRFSWHSAHWDHSPASGTSPPPRVQRSTGRGGHVQGPAALYWCALKPFWFINASEKLNKCLIRCEVDGMELEVRIAQSEVCKSREVHPPDSLQDATHLTFTFHRIFRLFLKLKLATPRIFTNYFTAYNSQLSRNSVTLCNSAA